jgi:hypothetical protein
MKGKGVEGIREEGIGRREGKEGREGKGREERRGEKRREEKEGNFGLTIAFIDYVS